MIFKRFLMAAAVVCGFALSAAPAFAVPVVDYPLSSSTDMGTVVVGQEGTILADHDGNLIINQIIGILPAHSMITFTYNFAGDLLVGALGSGASYSYDDGGVPYAGNAVSIAPLGFSSAGGTVDGAPSSALVMASAQIDLIGNTATAVIKNLSSGLANYANLFVGLVHGNKDLSIEYSVSAVPVPAALPLFGLGLGGLAGFGIRRKRKAAEDAVAA